MNRSCDDHLLFCTEISFEKEFVTRIFCLSFLDVVVQGHTSSTREKTTIIIRYVRRFKVRSAVRTWRRNGSCRSSFEAETTEQQELDVETSTISNDDVAGDFDGNDPYLTTDSNENNSSSMDRKPVVFSSWSKLSSAAEQSSNDGEPFVSAIAFLSLLIS